jgi:hypothetical protein
MPQQYRSPLTLFVIKKYQANSGYNQGSNSLKIATQFIVDMLLQEGHKAALAEADNQNFIGNLIDQYVPSIVILEALWVTPAAMAALMFQYPKVRFVIRINSEVPFLASEGIGVEWIDAFMRLKVAVAFNSNQAKEDFDILGDSIYLPNYYPMRRLRHQIAPGPVVNIGCFGAMRPLKNQVEQAFAAAAYAKCARKPLRFHMNDAADCQDVKAIRRSVKAIIEGTGNELVLHPWLDHEDFLDLIASMDICLQVSLSESFDITAADAVSMGVPLVGSSAIRWLPRRSQAYTGSAKSIVQAMNLADKTGIAMNHDYLQNYVNSSVEIWNQFIEG